MQKIIIIKYAELNTKKGNINLFLRTLKQNIEKILADEKITISYDKGRMVITLLNDNYEQILEKLQNVFGIHEIAIAYDLKNNDLEVIEKSLNELLKNKEFQTFKVVSKRSNKNYFLNSQELNKHLGGYILKNFSNKKVDVLNPNLTINVEIRKTTAFIYFEKLKGLGGYPTNTLGKGLLMLSGGIDSPVAGFMAQKRGVKIEAIYFESPPHTSDMAKEKVISLASKLAIYQGNIKIHVIPFTKIQETIYKNVPNNYLITIMRRMMYKIAEKIAKKNRCQIIINGECLGQVASQTLESLNVINEVVKMPVIRPVACFDKLEIIEIAKKINTYETSILPYQDCCTIFVPDHPIIYPTLDKCLEYEKNFDYDVLINESVKNETIIDTSKKEENYNDYL